MHIKLTNTLPLLTYNYNIKPSQTFDLHKFQRLTKFLSFQDQNTLISFNEAYPELLIGLLKYFSLKIRRKGY